MSYYARYVDDIIAVFIPSTENQDKDYSNEVKEIIEGSFGLELNDKKTVSYDLRGSGRSCVVEIEYLGYKIIFGDGEVKTKFTAKKMAKYKQRIELALNHYLFVRKFDEKKARKMLIKRMRFLTGNTRLKNNKNNILVGIYNSNSQLTEKTDLIELDNYLGDRTKSLIQMPQLKRRLGKFSFQEGFEKRRFSPFKTRDLQEIMRIWK